MNCEHQDCNAEATKEVILVMRSSPDGKPATTSPIVRLCQEHSNVKWDDIISPEGWKGILKQFKREGFVLPVKKHSEIKVQDIQKIKSN